MSTVKVELCDGTMLHGDARMAVRRDEVLELIGQMLKSVNVAKSVIYSAEEACAEIESNSHSAAKSSEEMQLSIGEISLQADAAFEKISKIVVNSSAARGNAERLQAAVSQISSVGSLIAQLARQTRLLALNAKIEASHAGTVGQGFAVVAEEVKALAHRTSLATEEIASQVLQVQSASSDTILSIEFIGRDVGDMNCTIESIAVATASQRRASAEVASAIGACATALTGLRGDLKKIQGGAVLGAERTAKLHLLVTE